MERQEPRTKKRCFVIGGKTMVQSSANGIDVNRYSAKDRVEILCNVQVS